MEKIFGSYPDPLDGGIYTVVGLKDDLYFELQEFKHDSYRKEFFIPLSEIDEKEFIREYNLEKV